MLVWQRLGSTLVAAGAVLVLGACAGASTGDGAAPVMCGPEVETGPTIFVNVLPLHQRVAEVVGCVSGLQCQTQKPRLVRGPPKMRLVWFRYSFDRSVTSQAVTPVEIRIRMRTVGGRRIKHDLHLRIPSTKFRAPCGPGRLPGIAMVSLHENDASVIYVAEDDFKSLADATARG